MNRCPWPRTELDLADHATEWGVPLPDDRALFELPLCCAFMQATGMVNDHLVTCFRHREITATTGS